MGEAKRVMRLASFMGEQEEREATVAWLRGHTHGAPLSIARQLADAIELGCHREPKEATDGE